MKQKVVILFLLLMSNVAAWGASEPVSQTQDGPRRSFLHGDVLEIELREAGTLEQYLGPGEDRRVRYIRLSGVMNGDDAKFIRRLCERSKANDANDRNVDNYIDLELERVRIVGGGSYSNRSERDVISNSMFSGSRCLRYVSLPRDLRKIGRDAFYGCSSLEEVRFVGRSNLREIDNDAFRNCYELSRINLPEGLERIGDGCFNYCGRLRRIDLPNTLREIGKEAFANTGLTDVRLPRDLEFMGSNAFKNTKIVSLFLPQGVRIENDALGSMSKLKEIIVERGNRYYTCEDGVLYDATGEVLLYCPSAKSGAFTVPNGVTTLKNGSFASCGSLTSVMLPQTLVSIGTNAFANCSSLGIVIIPESVSAIGASAFSGCKRLATATIDASITAIAPHTFENCESLQSIVLPLGLQTIGEKAFNECKSLLFVEWGNSLTSIAKEAFRKCGFVNLELPNSVNSIGENAFRDCKSLQTIVFPDDLKIVEKEIMRGCEKLIQVNLPARLVVIGENAFRDCKALSSIIIPEGTTAINNNAFRGTALTEITLPTTITNLGSKIVEKCKMHTVTCLAITPPALEKVSEKKTPLYVPAGSVAAYQTTKPWKEYKTILPINQ